MRVPVVVFVLLLSAGAGGQEEPKGDPSVGWALFTGEQPFEKGGAPCGSCHAFGSQSGLAASFGPDLATSKAALDLDVLDGVMADQPYRTMKPLYAGRPISAQERAHVLAWVREAAAKEHAAGVRSFAAQAAAIAIVLFALIAGRRPSLTPRQELARKARRSEGELR